MKKVGFLTETFNQVDFVDSIHTGSVTLDSDLISKITDYLLNGYEVISFMETSVDTEGNVIGPLQILTDGIWVWPSYFQYFLKKKPNMKIPEEFLDFLEVNRFKTPKIEEKELKMIRKQYLQN